MLYFILSDSLFFFLPSGFVPAVDGQMFRSSCLPKQLEAEWHFGGVKYRYGGNKEGKIRQIVASCKTNLFFLKILSLMLQIAHEAAPISG